MWFNGASLWTLVFLYFTQEHKDPIEVNLKIHRGLPDDPRLSDLASPLCCTFEMFLKLPCLKLSCWVQSETCRGLTQLDLNRVCWTRLDSPGRRAHVFPRRGLPNPEQGPSLACLQLRSQLLFWSRARISRSHKIPSNPLKQLNG